MKRITLSLMTFFIVLTIVAAQPAQAQQPQIPTLQVCNVPSFVSGAGAVNIVSRGSFKIEIKVECDPATGYPILGALNVNVAMNDSTLVGVFSATTVDQITVTGRITPTAYLSGRCTVPSGSIVGCRYWMMLVDNSNPTVPPGTADIVGFLVFDKSGTRIAYGTGPLVAGDISIAPSPF
jgi:hypothetical protein